MSKKLNIGLDWDGCANDLKEIFLPMVLALTAAGHNVYIVTMRYESESNEIEEWRQHVTNVIFTGRQAKEVVCQYWGININIWIDDNPRSIHMHAKEIWGFCTPEGFVDNDPHSTAPVMITAAISPETLPKIGAPKAYVGSGEFSTMFVNGGYERLLVITMPWTAEMLARVMEVQNRGVFVEDDSDRLESYVEVRSLAVLRIAARLLEDKYKLKV